MRLQKKGQSEQLSQLKGETLKYLQIKRAAHKVLQVGTSLDMGKLCGGVSEVRDKHNDSAKTKRQRRRQNLIYTFSSRKPETKGSFMCAHAERSTQL